MKFTRTVSCHLLFTYHQSSLHMYIAYCHLVFTYHYLNLHLQCVAIWSSLTTSEVYTYSVLPFGLHLLLSVKFTRTVYFHLVFTKHQRSLHVQCTAIWSSLTTSEVNTYSVLPFGLQFPAVKLTRTVYCHLVFIYHQ